MWRPVGAHRPTRLGRFGECRRSAATHCDPVLRTFALSEGSILIDHGPDVTMNRGELRGRSCQAMGSTTASTHRSARPVANETSAPFNRTLELHSTPRSHECPSGARWTWHKHTHTSRDGGIQAVRARLSLSRMQCALLASPGIWCSPDCSIPRCSSPWSLSSLFGAVCELPSPSCLSSGKEKQDAPPPQNAYASLGPAPAAFSASELAAMQNAAYASQQPYSSQLYASQLPAAASPPAYNQYNSMVQGAQPIPMSQAHAPVRGCCFSMWRGLAMSPVSGKKMPRAHIALDSSFCFGFVHLPNTSSVLRCSRSP